ncbi:MAG: cytochrome c peroxidase [Rhodocyclaceae bacterium]|nr:cytochrome c peroxidase [Rhodocyclaceae bacterium]
MNCLRLPAAALLACLPLAAAALSPLANLGQKIFNDPMLSASGRESCATCHAPGNAFLAPNTRPVQIGGANMNLSGFRNVPAVTYALFNPRQSPAGVPIRGGLQLDGRAMDLVAQAMMPFTSTVEMGNVTTTEVRQRLILRPYLAAFQAIFGATLLRDPDATVRAMGQAIAAYETEGPEFKRFNSKYDATLIGRAKLTPQEQNGQALFNSTTKGNCVMCHNGTGTTTAQMFTNYSYRAVGVPRNWKIPYNQDGVTQPSYVPANGANLGAPNHHYYDLGACGPFRTDLAGQTADCGMFKVPGLRNVALKEAYEHNGVFTSLAQVVDFYNTRDLQPERWYKKADGITPDIPYNDVPIIYQSNIERHPPFQPLPGNKPHLSASEIQDIVVFLCTLTDGYDPANPAAYPYPAQCKAALRP